MKPFFYSSLEPLFGPRSVSKKFQNIGTKPPLERADSNSTLGESPCPDDQITLYQGFRAVYPRLAKPMIRAGLPEKARHQMLSIQHIASLFTELLDERDVLIQGKDAIDEKQVLYS